MNNITPGAFRVFLLGLTITLIVCLNLPGLQFPPGGRQPQGPKPEKITILKMRVEEGRVNADISDVQLQNVLQELAERTGIIFEVRSQDNPPISIHVNRIPVQEFIQRITSGSNAIFLFGSGGDSDRITLVRIFPRTAQIQQPALVYLGAGAVTKTNNTVETPEQALQVLSGNASIEDREQGIEILVKNKGDVAVKALMGCISDPAPEIRSAAIDGLAAINARKALPGILKCLKDEHPGVRQSAITAVALLGDSANLKDLRPLSFDKDASVAAAAEAAIRKLSAIEKK
jgi:hypothetical protein